jgi:hypothetical protein
MEPETDDYGSDISPKTVRLIPNEHDELARALAESTGTGDYLLSQKLIMQLIAMLPNCVKGQEDEINASVAMLRGISPKDEIEGALAVQMVAVHEALVEMFKRLFIEGQTAEGVSECINRTTKLAKIYTMQMDALTKYRNRGGQKITVQHVQVNNGGRAVVGNLNHKGG